MGRIPKRHDLGRLESALDIALKVHDHEYLHVHCAQLPQIPTGARSLD